MSQRVVFAWVWALVVGFLLVHIPYLWLGERIAPDTDILALLPVQERDPVLQQAFTRVVDSAQQRLIVLVGADDWARLTALPTPTTGAGAASTYCNLLIL